MHSYLKSIGFSGINGKKEVDRILKDVISHYDENNEFQMEYYFPYFRGTGITTQEDVVIEKHAGKESYAGACDDVRIGVTIIFYLQNAGEYLTERSHGNYSRGSYAITLAALAKEGKILLPVTKDEKQEKEEKENTINRNRMIAAARNGDEDAMENLTMEDIDIYSMISGRIPNEDVYSIVDTYFMPYGMECDLYNVMGEIMDCSRVRNVMTNEEVYELRIACNDLEIDVCINTSDLMGEPEVGRRFKGVIWLQGSIHF